MENGSDMPAVVSCPSPPKLTLSGGTQHIETSRCRRDSTDVGMACLPDDNSRISYPPMSPNQLGVEKVQLRPMPWDLQSHRGRCDRYCSYC